MIPSLEAVALAAILSAGDPPDADRGRLTAIAADIALAVELGRIPFAGPAAREAAAVALVAIGFHESGWRVEVGDCRVRGDLGISRTGSVSFWQLLGPFSRAGSSVEDVCENHSLAALLALRVLDIHSDNCPHGPWLSAFQGYSGGRCGRHYDAAMRQCASWERLAGIVGLEGASCWRRDPIAWRAP